jgi:two-component system chemotaxis sensor kinase CheA
LNTNKDASSIISQNGFYCSLETILPQEQITAMTKGTLSVYTVEFISGLPNASGKAETPAAAATTAAPAAAAGSSADTEPAKAAASTSDASGDNGKGKAGKQNLINVDLNKLDTLMDLVGEIVITESMVSGSSDLAGLELDNFNRAARQLRKLTDELQDIVMSIRMVPIASTFQKMRRIVRDMGKKLDKDVDLVLMGEATEVDKTIIDGIADPLMHLVRNAMDHAIEDKDGRAAAKKDPVGRIILSAQNIGGDIIISVSDDGKGLDAEMILEKAKAKNLLTKPENDYTEKEIFNLLTMPGFSTKEAVTEFSGRGVGMDVVKKNIEKIGGTVTIESVKGSGTNIFFKIPLTLAIIASMEIKVGSNVYAIPINNIRESFKATQKQLLTDPDGNEMIMIRGVCYPIIRLHKIFHLQDAQTSITEGILLLVDSGDRLACILADELLGKHQVVVKPLPVYLSRYAAKGVGIAGCTILGDGSISLILDVQGILNQY